MKFQKKKKTEARKLRKQKRNKPQQPFAKWLTPELNKKIWKLARQLTSQRKYPPELLNKRFKCDECNRVYCICFDETIAYCDECYAKAYCAKEIRSIRRCI